VQLAPITTSSRRRWASSWRTGLPAEGLRGDAGGEGRPQGGDVILEFEGVAVKDLRDLQLRVAKARPGADVKLTYLRDGKKQNAVAKLVEFREEGLAIRPDEDDGRGARGRRRRSSASP